MNFSYIFCKFITFSDAKVIVPEIHLQSKAPECLAYAFFTSNGIALADCPNPQPRGPGNLYQGFLPLPFDDPMLTCKAVEAGNDKEENKDYSVYMKYAKRKTP